MRIRRKVIKQNICFLKIIKLDRDSSYVNNIIKVLRFHAQVQLCQKCLRLRIIIRKVSLLASQVLLEY